MSIILKPQHNMFGCALIEKGSSLHDCVLCLDLFLDLLYIATSGPKAKYTTVMCWSFGKFEVLQLFCPFVKWFIRWLLVSAGSKH